MSQLFKKGEKKNFLRTILLCSMVMILSAACAENEAAKRKSVSGSNVVDDLGNGDGNGGNDNNGDPNLPPVDTTKPNLTVTAPQNQAMVMGTTTYSGTCETGLVISIVGNVATEQMVQCQGGSFSTPVMHSMGDGVKNVMLIQQDAAGNNTTVTVQVQVMPPPVQLNGASLYATHCASCHRALANSDVLNHNAMQITNSIANVGVMRNIVLTPAQIQAIADAL